MEFYTDQTAYEHVMAAIRTKCEGSPQSWLAQQLGVTRQSTHKWKSEGFPPRQAEPISRLTGVPVSLVCPSAVANYLPMDIFQDIACRAYRRKRDFGSELERVIRKGLRTKGQ